MNPCLVFATLVAISACSKQTPRHESGDSKAGLSPVTAAEGNGGAVIKRRTAADVTFDGVVLGDTYKPLLAKPPYDKPCDDDPVNRAKSMRAMVYGATPCRGNSFDDGTTLIVYIPNAEGDEFDVPIRAVIWLGGSYFDTRSTLGLKIGATRKKVHDVLGPPTTTLAISERMPLTAEVYEGSIYAIFDGDAAAGYGLGQLPRKPVEGDEHWGVVDQMYRKYTARVTTLSQVPTRDECETLIKKYIALMKTDPSQTDAAAKLEARREDAIGKCRRKFRAEDLACANKATTSAELRKCETDRD